MPMLVGGRKHAAQKRRVNVPQAVALPPDPKAPAGSDGESIKSRSVAVSARYPQALDHP